MFSLAQLSYFTCSEKEQEYFDSFTASNFNFKLCCRLVMDYMTEKSDELDEIHGMIFVIKDPHEKCLDYIKKNVQKHSYSYSPILGLPHSSNPPWLLKLFKHAKKTVNQ